MKCLRRNKTEFKYCLYDGLTDLLDDHGDYTGEQTIQYEEPATLKASISASKGDDSVELFGIALDYDKTIIIDDKNCPIDENTIIFIDREPEWDETTKTLKNQDYIITRIAKSLNFIAIAVKKVRENGRL